jgi:hypothetical protein
MYDRTTSDEAMGRVVCLAGLSNGWAMDAPLREACQLKKGISILSKT